MNRDGHEAVKFFYGTEVEHTPAFGKRINSNVQAVDVR